MIKLERTLAHIWREELFEKITYFRDHLEEALSEAHHRDVGIIESLRKVVDALEAQLAHASKMLKVSRAGWSLEEACPIYVRLNNTSLLFSKAHEALYWTYTPWAEAETYSMLRSLFRKESEALLYDSLHPTIAFVPDFNAVHTEMQHRYWPNLPEITDHSSLVAIPKIAKRDCLLWPILGHEIGHAIYEKRGFRDRVGDRLFPRVGRKGVEPRILFWAEELACDMLALTMFGPAYLFAFSSFISFFSHSPLVDSSTTHPAPLYRIAFMVQQLKRRLRFDASVETERHALRDIEFCQELIGARVSLQNKADGFFLTHQEVAEDRDLAEFITETISELDGELLVDVPNFDKKHYLRAAELSEPFARGLIICSWRSPQSEAKALEVLRKENVAKDFATVCSLINEEPNEPIAILNAAWIHKLRLYRNNYVWPLPVPEETTREEPLEGFDAAKAAESYRQRNWRIQKSMETSLIHSSLKGLADYGSGAKRSSAYR